MHGNQRNNQPVLLPKTNYNRCQKGGDHNIVRRGWQAHSQNQAEDRCKDEDQKDLALAQEFNQLSKNQSNACLGDRTNNNPGSGCRNADTDHIACAGNQSFYQLIEALLEFARLFFLTEKSKDLPLGEQDENHQGNSPKC